MKRIAILGSTGSIGRSTLSIVESYPERFSVISMAAGTNLEAAFADAKRWKPKIISMAKAEDAAKLKAQLHSAGLDTIQVEHGSQGTVRVATHPEADFVVSAIVGVAGLEATYQAVKPAKTLSLPNKQSLLPPGAP